jgi:D-3-phosphoglycerate dehydrogenase
MIKVAVLDDYQDAFQQIVETEKYKDKFSFKVFNEPFVNEKEAIVELEDFEALFIMRERIPMTKSLIESLPKLKYIMTSGMRNNAINFRAFSKHEARNRQYVSRILANYHWFGIKRKNAWFNRAWKNWNSSV